MNHKFFCLFLLYTACTCLLSLLLLIIRVFHCGYLIDAHEKEEALGDPTSRSYERDQPSGGRRFLVEQDEKVYRYPECNDFYASHLVMGLLIASIVFLVFTCAMGCEQIEAIETGKGKIARMKMKVGQAGTEFKRVTEEFNEMFGGQSPRVSWHWFLPQPISFPPGMRKVVLGYEWDASFDVLPYESDGSDRELDEMEMCKTVSRVPSTGVEGDGLVKLPSSDDISLSDVSLNNDDNPNLKNRKTAASRQETGDSDGAVSPLPRIS